MSLVEAINELNPPQIEQKPSRKRISKRMQQVLVNLATKGMTQREAAKLAGMSEFHLSRELKKPQIQMFIARVAREKIAVGTLRASSRLLELVDCDSATTSFDASKHVLAIAGIKPAQDAQLSVSIDIKAGYVIDISDRPIGASANILPTQIDGYADK